MKTQEEYLKSFDHCPHCGSDDFQSQAILSIEMGGNWMPQDMECNACGAMWTDNYTLTGFTMQHIPPIQLQARWVTPDGEVDLDGIQHIKRASKQDFTLGHALIGLYQRNPITKEWEWLSDYRSVAELQNYTGISENFIQ